MYVHTQSRAEYAQQKHLIFATGKRKTPRNIFIIYRMAGLFDYSRRLYFSFDIVNIFFFFVFVVSSHSSGARESKREKEIKRSRNFDMLSERLTKTLYTIYSCICWVVYHARYFTIAIKTVLIVRKIAHRFWLLFFCCCIRWNR